MAKESPADRIKREQAEKREAEAQAKQAKEDEARQASKTAEAEKAEAEQRAVSEQMVAREQKKVEEAEREARMGKTDAEIAASDTPVAKQAIDTKVASEDIAERNQDMQEAIGGVGSKGENLAMAHTFVDNTTSKPIDADTPEARATLESQLRVDAETRAANRGAHSSQFEGPHTEQAIVEEEVDALSKERQERFARAEAFEREREEKLRQRNEALRGQAEARTADRDPRASSQSLQQSTRDSSGMDKLHKIVQAMPSTTPNEHVLFGIGGVRVTAGDLRDVTGMRRT